MSHPEIIIPFALPPAEHAKDLVKLLTSFCASDGLAILLARAQSRQISKFDDFEPQLPHENWLSKKHNFNALLQLKDRLSLQLTDGYWFLANPVNLHIASNHLVLTDHRQLTLADADSRLLFEKACAIGEELGKQIVYGDAANWFLRADDWSALRTSTLDAACGRNIDIWSPKGKQELAWRKLQNEIQMEWFIHPIQEQRQLLGQKVVNGLWLWSGTAFNSATRSPLTLPPNPTCDDFLATPSVTLIDQLSVTALAGDWGTWAQSVKELDESWFRPLVAALKSNRLQQLNLILTNTTALQNIQISSGSLRKFWRSPSFHYLSQG